MAVEKSGVSPMFDIIALKTNVKNKREVSLDDLLKCVTGLADATGSLRDYGVIVTEDDDRNKIDMYLKGLLKIQDGLLEMARRQIAKSGTMEPKPQATIGRIAPGE